MRSTLRTLARRAPSRPAARTCARYGVTSSPGPRPCRRPRSASSACLPWYVAAAQASYIQGLVLAHALAAPSAAEGRVLGRTAQQMRDEVERAEETRRKVDGVEPFVEGQCVLFPSLFFAHAAR